MSFLANIFDQVFYQPLFNALVLIYKFIPGNDLGIAVLLLTLLIKALLYPLNLKSLKSQEVILKLEPKIKEIKKKFKDDKERIAKETLELYQKEKINPFSGIFLVLIQFPVLFALYGVFSKSIFTSDFSRLYSFIPDPGEIKTTFLTIDLARPDFALAAFVGILQFFQARIQFSKKTNLSTETKTKNLPGFSEVLNKQMLYFFPAFTFFILLKVPSAISLYLIASTAFAILQKIYVQKTKSK